MNPKVKAHQIVPEQQVVLRTLAESVARQECKFLEIGSWAGDTACVLGHVARKNNGRLFCVDWWKGSQNTDLEQIAGEHDMFDIFWRRMGDEGLDSTVVPIRTNSDIAAEILHPGQFDLIFIDGDHRYNQIVRDIRNYAPLVRPNGGIFCGHDCEGRLIDFDREFLESGKNTDAVNQIHCGVVLAVHEAFEEYSINYHIWSVRATGKSGGWVPTELTFAELDNDGEMHPVFLESYKSFNIIKFRGRIYALEQALGEINLQKISEKELSFLRKKNSILVMQSIDEAKKLVNKA